MASKASLTYISIFCFMLKGIAGTSVAKTFPVLSPTDPALPFPGEQSSVHGGPAPPGRDLPETWGGGGPGKKPSRFERRRLKHQKRKRERQARREERRKNWVQMTSSKSHPLLTDSIRFQEDLGVQSQLAKPEGSLNSIPEKQFPNRDESILHFSLPPQTSLEPEVDKSWLERNISSIWLTLHHIQKEMKQLRRRFRADHQGRSPKMTPSPGLEHPPSEPCDPDWEVRPTSCIDEEGRACGWKGRCSCGQCVCEAPYYGIHCHCNDMTCDRHNGVLCGGAGRGQCRCGACVCRAEFTGSSCECSLSTSECQGTNGQICNGKGNCVCNRCHCQDGYIGKHCDELIYSASICERLKPCVLCKAYGKINPQCEDCNINVKVVEDLESSRATCLMVNLGCILKYAYISSEEEGEEMTVLVKKDRSC